LPRSFGLTNGYDRTKSCAKGLRVRVEVDPDDVIMSAPDPAAGLQHVESDFCLPPGEHDSLGAFARPWRWLMTAPMTVVVAAAAECRPFERRVLVGFGTAISGSTVFFVCFNSKRRRVTHVMVNKACRDLETAGRWCTVRHKGLTRVAARSRSQIGLARHRRDGNCRLPACTARNE